MLIQIHTPLPVLPSRPQSRTLVLCYLSLNPHVSYCQGMTDLALPLLAAMPNLSLAFWCYVHLMDSHSLLVGPDTAAAMRKEIVSLLMCVVQSSQTLACWVGLCARAGLPSLQGTIVSLVQCLAPCFYEYLATIEGGLDMLFCHRWLFVCFKREFPIEDILQLWEACWACQESHSFHLLVAVAIIAMYGDKAIEQEMPSDSLMIHFAGLAHSMPVEVILSQSRGLLHRLSSSDFDLPHEVSDFLLCNLQSNETVSFHEPITSESV